MELYEILTLVWRRKAREVHLARRDACQKPCPLSWKNLALPQPKYIDQSDDVITRNEMSQHVACHLLRYHKTPWELLQKILEKFTSWRYIQSGFEQVKCLKKYVQYFVVPNDALNSLRIFTETSHLFPRKFCTLTWVVGCPELPRLQTWWLWQRLPS